MKSSSFYVACVASLAMVWSAGCATAPRTTGVSRPPDVIYVPTSPEMVDVMLKMADVKPGEMVYDLGCGDGRIVVTAARDFGARGIGVDIDPERIRESRQNVRDAKVGDRVQIKYRPDGAGRGEDVLSQIAAFDDVVPSTWILDTQSSCHAVNSTIGPNRSHRSFT